MNIEKKARNKGAWAAVPLALLAIAAGTVIAGKTWSAPVSHSAPAPTLAQSLTPKKRPEPKSEYESILIHLTRISLIDCYGHQVAGWQITRFDRLSPLGGGKLRPWDAYDSLYSPDLRRLLKELPKGTVIGLEKSPAAITYPPGTVDPDERELDDFVICCRADGLRVVSMPIS